jgi:hypothetical protein
MSELKHTQFMQGLSSLIKEELPPKYRQFHLGETRWFFQLYFGKEKAVHYEVSRMTAVCGRMLEIGLHFEAKDKARNQFLLDSFGRYILELREGLGDQLVAEVWDRGWTKVYEAYPNEELTPEAQQFAAQRLGKLIVVMQPLYEFIMGGAKR